MHVCVIGLGYVGLPTALKLAEAGHKVTGVDINARHIERLRNRELSSPEAGLEELFLRVAESGRIDFSNTLVHAEAYIICVPTPVRAGVWEADLAAVFSVARDLKQYVTAGTLVVLESTVPPHTTQMVADLIGERRALYAHVPERVLPGNLLHELEHNDRIVGGLCGESGKAAAELYRSFVRGRIEVVDAAVAEMAKLVENTYRDVNIALANECVRICHKLAIPADEVIRVANLHPRVNMLRPGPGVGGHCVAVDPWFIVGVAPEVSRLIRTAREVNVDQPRYVVQCLESVSGSLEGRRIALLGLAYKPNVDDYRESPGLCIIDELVKRGAKVRVHDPYISEAESWISEDLEDLLDWAQIVMIVTAHDYYCSLPTEHLGRISPDTLVFDTCGVTHAEHWRLCKATIRYLAGVIPELSSVQV